MESSKNLWAARGEREAITWNKTCGCVTGLFPSRVHSNVRDKLPQRVILINTKIAPPECENLPKTGFTLFNQASGPGGARLRSGYWSLWVGWLVPPRLAGEPFPGAAMWAWWTLMPVEYDTPRSMVLQEWIENVSAKDLEKVRSYHLQDPGDPCPGIWTKEHQCQWNWKFMVLVSKFKIWRQHYDLNLSLQRSEDQDHHKQEVVLSNTCSVQQFVTILFKSENIKEGY